MCTYMHGEKMIKQKQKPEITKTTKYNRDAREQFPKKQQQWTRSNKNKSNTEETEEEEKEKEKKEKIKFL